MGTYDADRIDETIPLVQLAHTRAPQWFRFESDDPRLFRRLVYWLTTNDSSPLRANGEPVLGKTVVEWQTPTGWTTDIRHTPVTGTVGRVGRFRFRAPRKATP